MNPIPDLEHLATIPTGERPPPEACSPGDLADEMEGIEYCVLEETTERVPYPDPLMIEWLTAPIVRLGTAPTRTTVAH
ncbi:hypothetical protein J8F10_15940 [Gemmata sp. G18]|uniref:Uncharacterized protein n=1 Tax=Gemmata palustris TaxID=2822762 RepID=A0ABS5BSU1_9BACT|nr:hypothetical protein [Gemmata palustris]MBP3956764.1 hypothetical protein [Gemmata palustris]